MSDDPTQHLQQAVLELIAATRGVLDLAEQAVREPGGLASIVTDTLAAFAALVPKQSEAPAGDHTVEHIRIS